MSSNDCIEVHYSDLKAHYLFEEHMHALEQAEEEKDRQADEAFLAYGAEGFDEEVEVPA